MVIPDVTLKRGGAREGEKNIMGNRSTGAGTEDESFYGGATRRSSQEGTWARMTETPEETYQTG